jgi:hypothetical protein
VVNAPFSLLQHWVAFFRGKHGSRSGYYWKPFIILWCAPTSHTRDTTLPERKKKKKFVRVAGGLKVDCTNTPEVQSDGGTAEINSCARYCTLESVPRVHYNQHKSAGWTLSEQYEYNNLYRLDRFDPKCLTEMREMRNLSVQQSCFNLRLWTRSWLTSLFYLFFFFQEEEFELNIYFQMCCSSSSVEVESMWLAKPFSDTLRNSLIQYVMDEIVKWNNCCTDGYIWGLKL